jgi:hypothetical protein
VTERTHTARFVLATLVLALVVVPVAIAGKGGHGHDASISFNPSTVAVGQQYQVNLSGFTPNTWVSVGAHYPEMTWWGSGATDANGDISLTFTATSAGLIYHEAKEMQRNDSFRVRATATLNVSP